MSDPLVVLAELFDRAGIPYALIGGHAVNVWLEPRFTADVDVTVEADAGKLERLRGVLEAAGFCVEVAHGAEQPSGPDFVRFRSGDRRVVLEIQAAKTALQREVIRRAQPSDRGLRVATVEDLIVLKLIADRPRDRVDLHGLARLRSVDWRYVEHWAQEWELLDSLARLRREAGGAGPAR